MPIVDEYTRIYNNHVNFVDESFKIMTRAESTLITWRSTGKSLPSSIEIEKIKIMISQLKSRHKEIGYEIGSLETLNSFLDDLRKSVLEILDTMTDLAIWSMCSLR